MRSTRAEPAGGRKPIMNTSHLQEMVIDQLGRVLDFFSRVENKMSFLFALDGGLLTIVALNIQASDFRVWYVVTPAAVAVVLLALSLWALYRCWSPDLVGGGQSLIYFRYIARRDEATFVNEFRDTDAR